MVVTMKKCIGCGHKIPDEDLSQDKEGVLYAVCPDCADESERVGVPSN